ncbi:MAG: serine/threonine protein kinase [Desertifilum sp. SIO1I2]|nr:serine/threonine protein kinase [Desertifilum sp. SIO1I2]
MTTSAFSELFQSPLAGRYAIERSLGKQVGRQTFLAYDLQSQVQVVIKLLLLGKDFQWQDLKLFEREAKTLQSLHHPAIPRYLDYLDINLPRCKGVALVQSYIDAQSLEAHLRAGRTFSQAEVQNLAKALLEILIYLHQQSPPVIHRDIKPSNILLTDTSDGSMGQIYLVDFGSVQHLAAKQGTTITVVGTYGYMPPEQFGGHTTPASDLYSLGVTLIYLITGQHPTELEQQGFRLHFQHSSLAPIFVDWLKWLIEPSPDERPASAKEALQVLENPRSRRKRVTIQQPKHSKIVLNKTPECLDVRLPQKGMFRWPIVVLLGVVSFIGTRWIHTTIRSTPALADYAGKGLYLYTKIGSITTLVVVLITLLLVALLYKCLSSRVHLRINRKQVSLVRKSFIFEWQESWGATQSVEQILICPLLRTYEVVIQAESREYTFGKGLLTRAEARWLAHELSNWLDVPCEEWKN